MTRTMRVPFAAAPVAETRVKCYTLRHGTSGDRYLCLREAVSGVKIVRNT